MQLKHTPGPWEIERGHNTNRAKGIKQKRFYINIINFNGISRSASEEGEYNARLIAAAPEMLEALINITTNMRNEEPILIDIDIIIEKATGMKIEDILK